MTTPNEITACIALPLEQDLLDRIGAHASIRTPVDGSSAALLEAATGAKGLLCSNQITIDGAVLDALPGLRVVSGFGVGYDKFDVAAASARGVAICNTPGVLTAAVADLTLGLILAAARHIVPGDAYVRSGEWAVNGPGRPPLGFDLAGKTLGLVGFGRIGQAVAVRARAFGMRVVYHDLFPAPPEFEDCAEEALDTLLAISDVVSLHVNLDEQTLHLIDAEHLAQMKPTAWLVNTSRGPVIDQVALADALQRGVIAGAALDVLEAEPPDANEPLVTLPNVITLPHVGSATVETRRAMRELAVDNLLAVLTGRLPTACVNPEVLTGV